MVAIIGELTTGGSMPTFSATIRNDRRKQPPKSRQSQRQSHDHTQLYSNALPDADPPGKRDERINHAQP